MLFKNPFRFNVDEALISIFVMKTRYLVFQESPIFDTNLHHVFVNLARDPPQKPWTAFCNFIHREKEISCGSRKKTDIGCNSERRN